MDNRVGCAIMVEVVKQAKSDATSLELELSEEVGS